MLGFSSINRGGDPNLSLGDHLNVGPRDLAILIGESKIIDQMILVKLFVDRSVGG